MISKFKDNGKNKLIVFFVLAACLVSSLIWCVTNVGIDATYQIAMGYRMLKGDRLFVEMMDPNQTSAFLTFFLEWAYTSVTHTTTGIVVFLNAMGVIINIAVAVFAYFSFKPVMDKLSAFACALLLFYISPKDVSLPDYANQQVWFSILMFAFLIRFLVKKKYLFVVLAACSLCLAIISYPSCIIIFPVVSVVFFATLKKGEGAKAFAAFAITCVLLGLAYIFAFVGTAGLDNFALSVKGMFELTPSHTITGADKWLGYLKTLGIVAGILLAVIAVSKAIELLCVRDNDKKILGEARKRFRVVISLSMLMVYFLVNILLANKRFGYSIILVYIILIGFSERNRLGGVAKKVYCLGMIIGVSQLIATLVLTNLSLLDSIPYSCIATMVSFLPVIELFKNGSIKELNWLKACALIMLALFFVRSIYVRTPINSTTQIASLKDEMSLIRNGPAKFLITDTGSACRQRDSYIEFNEYVSPGSSILLIDAPLDSLAYLYNDYYVSAPNTTSTPWLSQTWFDYWERFPQKNPDVVALSAYNGTTYYGGYEGWLKDWLEDENTFDKLIGTYWIFYIRK